MDGQANWPVRTTEHTAAMRGGKQAPAAAWGPPGREAEGVWRIVCPAWGSSPEGLLWGTGSGSVGTGG